MNSNIIAAQAILGQGFSITPLRANGKIPTLSDWVNRPIRTPQDAERLIAPDANVGVVTGNGLIVVDIDTKNGKDGRLWSHFGVLGDTYTVRTPSGGLHFYFYADPATRYPNSAGKLADGVDIRGDGGQVVAAGSLIDGNAYEVLNYAPIATAPPWLLGLILDKVSKAPRAAKATVAPSGDVCEAECARIREALFTIPTTVGHDAWLAVVLGLSHRFAGGEDGYALALEWCAGFGDDFDQDELDNVWGRPARNAGETVATIGSVYATAQAHGFKGGGWQTLAAHAKADDSDMRGYEAMGGTQAPLAARANRLEFPDDISLEAIKERERGALVKGLIYPGQLGVLYGDPKAGKTFAALDLAWHIALGTPWHGIPVKRAPVLYISLEGNDGFKKRQLAARKAHGDTGKHFARCLPTITLTNDAAGAAGVAEIVAAVKDLANAAGAPVGLIVIDTMARALAGQNEDTTDAMSAFVEKRAAEIQRQTGSMVLIVHHTNKGGTMRGSQVLLGSVDVCFRVDLDAKTQVRTLILETAKDVEPRKILDYRLEDVELGQDDDGSPIKSALVAPVHPIRSASTRADMDTALKGIAGSKNGLATTPSGTQNAENYVAARLQIEQPAIYIEIQAAKAAARAALAALESDGEIERFKGDRNVERWRVLGNSNSEIPSSIEMPVEAQLPETRH